MGNILLTSAEYNDLYKKGKEKYIDGSKELLECKIVEDNTCIILDEDDKIIAQFDVNRPETNIFRDLTDCIFEIKSDCDEIKEINKTIKKLSKQLDAIIKKWEY